LHTDRRCASAGERQTRYAGREQWVNPGGRLVINVLLKGMTYMEMFEQDHYYLFEPGELRQCFSDWKILIDSQGTFAAPRGTQKKLQTLIVEKPAIRSFN
jgi:hypothetical protein